MKTTNVLDLIKWTKRIARDSAFKAKHEHCNAVIIFFNKWESKLRTAQRIAQSSAV